MTPTEFINSLNVDQRNALLDILQSTSPTKPRNRTAERSGIVATPTKSRKSAAAAKAKAKAAGAKSKAAPAKSNGTSKEDVVKKREAARKRDAELRAEVVERRGNDEKWAEIASDLNITSGKAQFLMMQHDVEEGTVPKISYRNDQELVAKAVKARQAEDEYSSWGWIAARTGVAEGRLKKLVEEAGHDVKGTNVAVSRGAVKKAEKAATQTNGRTKTGGGTATVRKGGTSTAKAKAKAAKAGKRRPSSRA